MGIKMPTPPPRTNASQREGRAFATTAGEKRGRMGNQRRMMMNVQQGQRPISLMPLRKPWSTKSRDHQAASARESRRTASSRIRYFGERVLSKFPPPTNGVGRIRPLSWSRVSALGSAELTNHVTLITLDAPFPTFCTVTAVSGRVMT